jgi:hypothetical protein
MGWTTWLPSLVLNDADYATVTKNVIISTAPLAKPKTINPNINKNSNQYTILTVQEELQTLKKEFNLQEAVTTISVQSTVDSIEEQ